MAFFLSDHYAVNSMRGGCLSCSNDQPRKRPHGIERIVVLDYEDEFLGTPEFCESCIEEIARALGMTPGRVTDKAKKDLATSKAEAKAVAAELEDAQATIRTLTAELHKQHEAVA